MLKGSGTLSSKSSQMMQKCEVKASLFVGYKYLMRPSNCGIKPKAKNRAFEEERSSGKGLIV